MAGKPVARLGDTGSHGGAISTASGTISVNSKKIARVGDTYSCPKHGSNPIVTGALSVFGQGQLVAHVGSKTACGATITSGSPDTFVDEPQQWGSPVILDNVAPDTGNMYFIVVDEEDTPMPDVEYILTDEDGTEYPGVTDKNGHTATIFGKVGENLHIRILASADDDEEISEEV